MRTGIAAALILVAAPWAQAGNVYKCTNPDDGAIAFQDHPCATGDTETVIQLAKPPPAQPAMSQDSGEGADTSAPPPSADARLSAARQAMTGSLPVVFECVNGEDGKTYMSRNGNPDLRMVPAGVMGIPGQSLAQAYGPGGIGVSAPGMRKIPVDTSPQSAVAGAYVAVQDHCVPAGKEQTCAYLRQQFDEVHQKLKRAFKDERAALQPKEDELNAELDGC